MDLEGPYLLLTKDEHEAGYYSWIGRVQKHYAYELVQVFKASLVMPAMYLVRDPHAITEPRESNEL